MAQRLVHILVIHEVDVNKHFVETMLHLALSRLYVRSLQLFDLKLQLSETGNTINEVIHFSLVDFTLLQSELKHPTWSFLTFRRYPIRRALINSSEVMRESLELLERIPALWRRI